MDLSNFSAWWPGLLFSFGCFVLTEVVRRIVEGIFPRAKVSHYWTNVGLPTIPTLLGAVAGLAWTTYPYPVENPTWSFRLLLGLTAGYASAWAVKVVKAIIKSKTGVDVDANSIGAPPTPPAS